MSVYSGVTVRPEFKKKVFAYCKWLDVKIEYGFGDSYDVYGSSDDMSCLSGIIGDLERRREEHRKSKNFIWRIFN
jgi:hypothetical protein